MADLDELKIPKATRRVAEDIILITDQVCAKLLDAEYADLARQVDGLVMDSRSLPIDYQVAAFQRGYIPYIPALGPEGTAAIMDADS